MKMMKKLLPLAALLIVVVMALASCSLFGTGFDDDIINTVAVPNTLTVSEISEVKDMEYAGSRGNIVLFKKDDKTVIYNVETNQIVKSDTNASHKYTLDMLIIMTVQVDGVDKSWSYYTPDWTPVVENSESPGQIACDCLYVNGMVYRFDLDTYEIIDEYERNDLAGRLPDCTHYSEDNYYNVQSDKVVVYDDEFGYVGTWEEPEYAIQPDFFFFESDGYVVCQYTVELDPLTDEYDIFQDSTKFDLVTVRIDPSDATADEIDVDYFIDTVNNYGNDTIYGEDGMTIAEVCEIVDGHVLEQQMILLATGSKLDGDRVYEVHGETIKKDRMIAIGNGYVIAKGESLSWLLDDDGDIVTEINGMSGVTTEYIITNEAIYDYELNFVKDLNEKKKYTYFKNVGDTAVFTAEDSESSSRLYYMFKGGSFELLGKEGEISIGQISGTYMKDNGETKTYYDAAGNALFTLKSVGDTYVVDDYIIVKGTTADDVVHFWRIAY